MGVLNLKRLSTHIDKRYNWDEENTAYIDVEDGCAIGDIQDVYDHIAEEYSATICIDEDFFLFVQNKENIDWETDYTEEYVISIAEKYGW